MSKHCRDNKARCAANAFASASPDRVLFICQTYIAIVLSPLRCQCYERHQFKTPALILQGSNVETTDINLIIYNGPHIPIVYDGPHIPIVYDSLRPSICIVQSEEFQLCFCQWFVRMLARHIPFQQRMTVQIFNKGLKQTTYRRKNICINLDCGLTQLSIEQSIKGPTPRAN